MNTVKPKILCLSRSYLSKLLPTLGKQDIEFEYLHVVQTDKEEKLVTELGGEVVLNIQQVVRQSLVADNELYWDEPEDMRAVTNFNWSAIYSDRYLVNFSESERSRIAGGLHKAVRKLFEENEFKGFVSEPVALFITHLIFYYSKKNNVKPLLWCNTYFSDHFYFASESEISHPVRSTPMSANEIERLHDKVDDYVCGIIGDKTGPVYHHSFSGTKQNRLGYFKQRKGESPLVLRPGWTSRVIQLLRLARAYWFRLRLKSKGDFMTAGAVSEHLFYLKCLFANTKIYSVPPTSFSEQNVVYPLQYEPEASLLYFAPHIINQISFVETTLKALPDGKLLWVKEHPNQFGALDTNEWLALKARYSNVRFIHGRENGRELIKNSALAVTISSSMGMDALLLGRRLLVAGNVFYDQFTGARKVESFVDLSEELGKGENYVIRDNVIDNTSELVQFGSKSYPGDPQPSHYLYDETNLGLLISAIHSEIKPRLNY